MTRSVVENWQETCSEASKLAGVSSPGSPAGDAESLDNDQDALEEEDEEEGHEVEGAIGPANIKTREQKGRNG